MISVKINEHSYPAQVIENDIDDELERLPSKEIILTSDFNTISNLFVDNAKWSILFEEDEETYEYDCSDYSVAGPIKDFRNGLISVKMGKPIIAAVDDISNILLGEEK